MSRLSAFPERTRARLSFAFRIRVLLGLAAWLAPAVRDATAGAPDSSSAGGFAVPQPGVRFEFPRDHGSHPDFRIEWWYLTGHLWDAADHRFGFQVTFFRTAAPRDVPPTNGTSAFGTTQLHLAHVALLDVGTGRFRHEERLNRSGWDAGADTHSLRVWNGNWSLVQPDPEGALRLEGSIGGDVRLRLSLTPVKPLVVFGTNGVSRKGADPRAASHYLTFTRLQVEGRLTLDGRSREVSGQAWMDHEFSSSQLSAGQTGWDWTSIQLQDGREIMGYRMRQGMDGTDPYSTLAWIDRSGAVSHVGADSFELVPLDYWRSPRSGARYPLGFRLRTRDPSTGLPVELRIEPLAADQELDGAIGGVPYWEGACRVVDERGREVGVAYLELTGYAGDLGSRLR